MSASPHPSPVYGAPQRSAVVSGPLGGVVLCALAFAVARFVRYRIVEPEAMGAACETDGPAWCPWRTGLVQFTEASGFGWLALAAAAAALAATIAGKSATARTAAFLALAAGGFGMVLYNATPSAPAVILALVCLAWRR